MVNIVKWLTIVAALAGTSVAVYAVATQGQDKPPSPPPAAPPSVNPFAHGIAASGTVEAVSRNIPIGTTDAGLVVDVMAQVGDKVTKGQPLFKLDDRLLQAELVRVKSQALAAEARVARLAAQPRPENLPPAEAKLAEAESLLGDMQSQLARWDTVTDRRAITEEEYSRKQYAVQMAKTRVAQAKADLDLLKAGAWTQDLAVARAEAAQAEADVRAVELRLERMTIRSPIDGTVLKRSLEPGQYVTAAATAASNAPMVVGDLSTLRVRARVDEEDAPQLRDGAAARARVRGVHGEEIDLKMVRVEPLAMPKQDLTGTTIERVDTRVVEVLFDIVGKPKSRLFPGQLVDVFIDAGSSHK